jgi:hypothetical protein
LKEGRKEDDEGSKYFREGSIGVEGRKILREVSS